MHVSGGNLSVGDDSLGPPPPRQADGTVLRSTTWSQSVRTDSGSSKSRTSVDGTVKITVRARQLGPGTGPPADLRFPFAESRHTELVKRCLHHTLDRDDDFLGRSAIGDINVDQAAQRARSERVSRPNREPAHHVGNALPRIQVPELVGMTADLDRQVE